MSYISAGNTTTTTLIQGGDTTGNLVFATGGANAAALKLDNAQNAQLTAAGAKLLNSSGNPMLAQTGAVLQVVQTVLATSSTAAVTSPTYVDIGLSASITPLSTSSKILVFGNIEIGWSTAAGGWLQIVRGTTAIGNGSSGSYANFQSGFQISGVTPANNFYAVPFCYLDSPANVSAQTYKIQASLDANGTLGINRRQGDAAFGGASVITLMEIAA